MVFYTKLDSLASQGEVLVRESYRKGIQEKSDKELDRIIVDYETFQHLPLFERFISHITLRAPEYSNCNWAKHELAVRRGEANPYWFMRSSLEQKSAE